MAFVHPLSASWSNQCAALLLGLGGCTVLPDRAMIAQTALLEN